MTARPGSARDVHIYAGTAGHSAWFSDDLGESWVHPNSHSGMYLEARVWCIASDPSTPEPLYAGTDMGLFRWDEPSARWTHLPSPMQDVWAVAIDPANPDRLIAGTRPAGFWQSNGAGATWETMNTPGLSQFSEVNMGPTRVTQILFDPVDKDTVWAGVEIGSVYRSRDRGRSWDARLNEATIAALRHPETAERLRGIGVEVQGTSPSELGAYLDGELNRWADLARHVRFEVAE